MPAKAGIQKYLKTLDSANGCALRLEIIHYVPCLRGNETKGRIKTFYENINLAYENILGGALSPSHRV